MWHDRAVAKWKDTWMVVWLLPSHADKLGTIVEPAWGQGVQVMVLLHTAMLTLHHRYSTLPIPPSPPTLFPSLSGTRWWQARKADVLTITLHVALYFLLQTAKTEYSCYYKLQRLNPLSATGCKDWNNFYYKLQRPNILFTTSCKYWTCCLLQAARTEHTFCYKMQWLTMLSTKNCKDWLQYLLPISKTVNMLCTTNFKDWTYFLLQTARTEHTFNYKVQRLNILSTTNCKYWTHFLLQSTKTEHTVSYKLQRLNVLSTTNCKDRTHFLLQVAKTEHTFHYKLQELNILHTTGCKDWIYFLLQAVRTGHTFTTKVCFCTFKLENMYIFSISVHIILFCFFVVACVVCLGVFCQQYIFFFCSIYDAHVLLTYMNFADFCTGQVRPLQMLLLLRFLKCQN